MIKYGLLHNHTQHSIQDSVVTIAGIVNRAKELGVPALAITDHGTMTGCFSFYKACLAQEIKPILGCEVYVRDCSVSERLHMVIYSKDYIGYQALMKCTKLANTNLTKVGTMVFPECTTEILNQCFGPGSNGYGHVIATSACINGVLAGLYRQNQEYAKNISKLEGKLNDEKNTDKAAVEDKLNLLKSLHKETRNEIIDYMKAEAKRYVNMFGEGNFYIELQYHYMSEEKEWMHELDEIAKELNIPTCAANDAHMLDNSEQSILARQTINSLRWNSLEPVSDSEKELYLKNDEELESMISALVGPSRARIAMEGTGTIVSACNVKLPEKPMHYPVFKKGIDAMALLRQKVREGIPNRFPDGFPDKEKYEARIEYELGIIEQLNVADYLLIVQDLLEFCRKLGRMPIDRYSYLEEHIKDMAYDEIVSYVDADQSYFGYVVGPGRGSSAGSEVCFIIGITDIDPIPYNLLMERFLNPERVTMPDIDSDYANGYRDLVIQYTYKRYGSDAVCRIITFGTNAAKAAIKNVARAIGTTQAKTALSKQSEEAIKKIYDNAGDRLSKVIPKGPHRMLSDYDDTWNTLSDSDKEIIDRAKSIEGSYKQYGMHACGVIISDNDDVNEYVPLSWDPVNECYKTQCIPAEAEELGLLKMDYLGLRNLNMITEMIRLIEKTRNIRINPSLIPVENKVIKSICGSARTNGIFQLESAGMKSMCKSMGMDSFEDIILGIAAYRPGPMDSIPAIIDVKTGRKPATYLIPELEHILNVTYAKPIYQEQIQQIFRDLAGYSFGQADNVRRAMSKKKEAILLHEREAFIHGDKSRNIEGCEARGIDPEKANQLFDDMVSFAKYAFNKSHAAVYARVAYILMWLKYYYFQEFMTVLLKWSKPSKQMALIAECREQGIKVLLPDINKSESGCVTTEDSIIYGLTSIKEVASVDEILQERNLNGPFKDLKDFMSRVKIKKNVLEALIWAGAFDSIISSRKGAILMMTMLTDVLSERREVEKKKDEQEKILKILREYEGKEDSETLRALKAIGFKNKTVPKIDKKLAQIVSYDEDIEALDSELAIIEEPTSITDDKEENLKKEKELLEVYLSGHPTDSYVASSDCVNFSSLKEGKYQKVFGAIESLKTVVTKKSGKTMAFFNLEGRDGSIEAICFPKEYERYKDLVIESAVVEIVGNIEEEEIESEFDSSSEEDNSPEDAKEVETIFKLYVTDIISANKKQKTVVLDVEDLDEWNRLYPTILTYSDESPNSYILVVWNKLENQLRKAVFNVRSSIVLDKTLKVHEM